MKKSRSLERKCTLYKAKKSRTERDFLFAAEFPDNPDDEYHHQHNEENTESHTCLKNIANQFTACNRGEEQCQQAQPEYPVSHNFLFLVLLIPKVTVRL
jgi:hypothetical protein